MSDKKKVAIVGYAPSSMGLAPFKDSSFEIWGINDLYLSIPWQEIAAEGRLRWFDLHPPETFHLMNRGDKHWEWLKEAKGFPVYLQKKIEEVPESVEYPLHNIVSIFGTYLTNSISEQIALALLESLMPAPPEVQKQTGLPWVRNPEGFDEIHLYGVDMALDSEYGSQKPSCEYFIGLAKAAGIRVYIPPQSDLLKAPFIYGYQSPEFRTLKQAIGARKNELQGRVQNLQNQVTQQEAQKHQMIGAIENCNFIMKNELNGVE